MNWYRVWYRVVYLPYYQAWGVRSTKTDQLVGIGSFEDALKRARDLVERRRAKLRRSL